MVKEQEGIPHMDELAMRLQVREAKEPYQGVVLFGVSGRAYSMVELMLNMTSFVAQTLQYMIAVATEIKGEEQEVSQDEPDKRTRQPKKADNPTGDTKGD
jgi:hypothetical protein